MILFCKCNFLSDFDIIAEIFNVLCKIIYINYCDSNIFNLQYTCAVIYDIYKVLVKKFYIYNTFSIARNMSSIFVNYASYKYES